LKILIVDDELVSRKKLAKILSCKGLLDECENGHQAIETFEKACLEGNPYRLVTLDINMPGLSGLQLLPMLRSIEQKYLKGMDIPAVMVMVTAETELESIKKAIKHSCSDYLVKPFEKDFVLARYEEWMAD